MLQLLQTYFADIQNNLQLEVSKHVSASVGVPANSFMYLLYFRNCWRGSQQQRGSEKDIKW